MLDEDLRAQLADWVAPLADLPRPDIRMLRRRTWRRRMRGGAATVAAAAAVAAVAAVVSIATLPGSGQPTVARGGTPAAAPGRWYPGRWFAAGQLPVPDASAAAAPYVVTIANGGEVVTDVLTGATAGAEARPPGERFAAVAAAGDDRTFVLAAQTGTSVNFYEQRLGPDGRPGSPVLVFALPASSVPAFALSPDASLLAYAMPGGLGVVSLTTGAVRSWTAAGGEAVGLSWAGDNALAFTWVGISAGEIKSLTVRLLATSVPGTRLMASRQLVPACANSSGRLCLEQNPLGAAGGSKVFVTSQFNSDDTNLDNGASALVANVEEFTGDIGRTVFSVTTVANSPAAASACSTLWTDPAGEHFAVYCAGSITINAGHKPSLHVPVTSADVENQRIAW
jgi:hypothetical protein